MDAKLRAAPTRVYKEIEPAFEWVPEQDCDTLLLYLPGFRKEQLRVQLNTRNLIISGERQIEDNIWSRFRKEFPVSTSCDQNKITARFDAGTLYIIQPKLIIPAEEQDEGKPTITEPPKPQEQTSSTTGPADHINEKTNASASSINDPDKNKPPENTKGKSTEYTDYQNILEKKSANREKKAHKNSVSEEKNSDGADEDGKRPRNTSEKRTLDHVNSAKNYWQASAGVATKLKMPRQVMNLVLGVSMVLVVSMYFKILITSRKKSEN